METTMKLLFYCTKAKPYLYHLPDGTYLLDNVDEGRFGDTLNGTIPCECDYELEEIYLEEYDDYNNSIYSKTYYETKTLQEDDLCKQSCLNADELDDYLERKVGYAIHIKNLHIFDEPRELNDFVLLNQYRKDLKGTQYNVLTKAPQNMCKVAYSKNCINKYNFNDCYKGECVLISIRPKWLCKILNGEKTIEIRKKVLKEMI